MILRLNNWRSFESAYINLPKHPAILCDQNGSGKTSVLAATYSLLTGNPWPQTKFNHSLRGGQNYFGVESQTSQSWYLNGKISPSGRLATRYEAPDQINWPFESSQSQVKIKLQKIKVLTYLPTDNSWLFESRTKKIRILDELLGQIYTNDYLEPIRKLTQACLQKQKLIRYSKAENQPIDRTLLTTLSQEILFQSKQIWQYRAEFFKYLDNNLSEFESWINTPLSNWEVRWETSNDQGNRTIVSVFELQLNEPDWKTIWEREIASEKILYGAQRDDFNLVSNHIPCQDVFSRGEMRSLVLFIKNLAQTLNLKEKTIWLVDDIFNELDKTREQTIFANILDKADWFLASSTQKVPALSTPHYSISTLTRQA